MIEMGHKHVTECKMISFNLLTLTNLDYKLVVCKCKYVVRHAEKHIAIHTMRDKDS